MAEQRKFEFGKFQLGSKITKKPDNETNSPNSQKKVLKDNPSLQEKQKNYQGISDDDFLNSFEQVIITNSQGRNSGRSGQDSDQIENPQAISDPSMKLAQEMHTMIDEQLEEEYETEQIRQELNQLTIHSPQKMINSEPLSVTTPQKFKKPINFQDIENDEEAYKLFWAPKKRLTRKSSQLNQ